MTKISGTIIFDVAVNEGLYTKCVGDSFELVILFNGAGIINIVAENIHTLVIQISGIRHLVFRILSRWGHPVTRYRRTPNHRCPLSGSHDIELVQMLDCIYALFVNQIRPFVFKVIFWGWPALDWQAMLISHYFGVVCNSILLSAMLERKLILICFRNKETRNIKFLWF